MENKPTYHINLRQEQQTVIDTVIGVKFILIFLYIGLAALGGIVYRLDAIKSALGL